MIPMERLALESRRTENDEDNERDHLLDHLKLHQAERAAIVAEAHSVGGHLKTVLKKRQHPAEQNHTDKRQMVEPAELLAHLQMAIPRTRHENIGNNQ